MPSKKSHDVFIAEMKTKNPDITIIGEYINSQTKIKCKCNVDEYEWEASPSNLLYVGSGCPLCTCRIGTDTKKMQEILNSKGFDVKVLTNGILSNRELIQFECQNPQCKHIWKEYFPCIEKRSYGCPKCFRKKQDSFLSEKYLCALESISSTEEYIDALQKVGSPLVPIENFVSLGRKTKHLCTVHNLRTVHSPTRALRGSGCYQCRIEKSLRVRKRTPEEYIKEIAIKNPKIEALEPFYSTGRKILHKCKVCGHQWKVQPIQILDGSGCPRCHQSRGERRISLWMENNELSFVSQCKFEGCKYISDLVFDFYIPLHNKAIEYQGEQHYQPVKFCKDDENAQKKYNTILKRDQVKRQYCKEHGIILLEIPYWEYNRIEEILKKELFADQDRPVTGLFHTPNSMGA